MGFRYDHLKTVVEQQVTAESRRNRLRAGNLGNDWIRSVPQPLANDQHTREPLAFEPAGLELIWNYFLEEAGLVQGFLEVCRRFQNRRSALARFDVSPLRSIGDFIDGYIDDLEFRDKLRQRSLEYDHAYGLPLVGKAIGKHDSADSRSRFVQAFHVLLNACMRFYHDADNLQVTEDPRKVLNALKDVHLLLSEGAHNNYSELPTKARCEFRIIQYILGLDELRYFLGGRIMVAYPEPWMPHLARLREIMKWGDGSITDYYHLAQVGEQLLLRIRFGPFRPGAINGGQRNLARQFALAFRDPITQYVHSYEALTGVDLGAEFTDGKSVDATLPSVYFARQEARARV